MTTNTVVKSCAKGLALGVLWPAAFVYVAGKKVSKVVGETASEALTLARGWTDEAEKGISEAVSQTFAKKPEVPEMTYAARSVGAAAADDKNVIGKPSWRDTVSKRNEEAKTWMTNNRQVIIRQVLIVAVMGLAIWWTLPAILALRATGAELSAVTWLIFRTQLWAMIIAGCLGWLLPRAEPSAIHAV